MTVLNIKMVSKSKYTYGYSFNARYEPSLFYINYFLLNFIFMFMGLTFFRLNELDYCFESFEINGFRLYNIYFWILLNISFFLILKSLNIQHQTVFKLDYLMTILNICFFFCLLMLCNNIYTFLMVMEVCSYFFLYKLVLSKNFNTTSYLNYGPNKQYYSIIFYHYWVSTLSTLMYMLFFFTLCKNYGCVKFGLILYVNQQLPTVWEEYFFSIFFVVFFFCFCLKLGLSPFHLFKSYVYDGLSYFYIFFYTTYYFIGFFFIISILYFQVLLPYSYLIIDELLYGIIISLILFVFSLTNVYSIKWFIFISTLLNLLNLFLMLLIYLT